MNYFFNFLSEKCAVKQLIFYFILFAIKKSPSNNTKKERLGFIAK